MTALTALTLGYGDLTPVTPIGRIAGVIFGHFWIFVVISMIIANIILHLVEDKNAFTDDEQREFMERLKQVEALVAPGHSLGPHGMTCADKQGSTPFS